MLRRLGPVAPGPLRIRRTPLVGAAGAARSVPGTRRSGTQRGNLPAIHGRAVVALRADTLLAGRARPLAARGRAALLAYDPHLRRHSLNRRQARLEAWRENDRGFRPRAVGGGAPRDEGHVARGWSLFGALRHGGRGR